MRHSTAAVSAAKKTCGVSGAASGVWSDSKIQFGLGEVRQLSSPAFFTTLISCCETRKLRYPSFLSAAW